MSFDHKAYAFDWDSFNAELLTILRLCLRHNETKSLKEFIVKNIEDLTDPYEGEPLDYTWENNLLENYDVQEYGDFALTKYYSVREHYGLADQWIEIEAQLSNLQKNALLGWPIGENNNYFDPGRMGSYFQDLNSVQKSQEILDEVRIKELRGYKEFLQQCADYQKGIYVTF